MSECNKSIEFKYSSLWAPSVFIGFRELLVNGGHIINRA